METNSILTKTVMEDQFDVTSFHPVCVTCGLSLGDKEEPYKNLIQRGLTPEESMDRLGISNICCRRHVVSADVKALGEFLHDPHRYSKSEIENTLPDIYAPSDMSLMTIRKKLDTRVVVTVSLKRNQGVSHLGGDIDPGSVNFMDPLDSSSIANSSLVITSPGKDDIEDPESGTVLAARLIREEIDDPFKFPENVLNR